MTRWAATGKDPPTPFGRTDFVKASAADFVLASGSPHAAGTSKSMWYDPRDFNGQARSLPPDMGAYWSPRFGDAG